MLSSLVTHLFIKLNKTAYLAVLFDLSQVLLNFLLTGLIFPLHAGLGESLLLGLGPVSFHPPKNKHLREEKLAQKRGEKLERKRNTLAKSLLGMDSFI